nr:uncharacterized protein LOC116778241 [Danaus plexippus plexippus]
MIALKKLYGDELLRLALVLSLLKANPEEYHELETQQLAGLHITNGTDWSLEHEARTLIRPRHVHPKSLDHILMNYERQLFEELNSLGRYNYLETNDRPWYNQPVYTYLLNDVATDTIAPALGQEESQQVEDNVSADENVAQEVKVEEEKEETAVVTLSADFLQNHTESDIFAEIASRSFDVNEFLNPEMQIKKEEDLMIEVKKEKEIEDVFSDNAIDDFVPYFTARSEKIELGEANSVFNQNIADLQDYDEFDVKELNNLEHLDVKQQQENLEQYLLENTPLDSEVYELAPMFEEEMIVKRERASTSFTSASSSGVSEMDSSSKDLDVKLEPDEGHHSGEELTQEDMNLIEVLWKQDVDMGFSLEDPLQMATRVNVSEELKNKQEQIEKVKATLLDEKEDDPWAGLSYTVDTETGEYVIQGDLPGELVNEERFNLLEETLRLVELGDEGDAKDEQPQAVEGSSSGSMLHPAMRHVPHHPLAHYHNQSLMRSIL